jgi:hypothetical protein
MVDSLEDMGAALSGTNRESLSNLYQAIGLQIATNQPPSWLT